MGKRGRETQNFVRGTALIGYVAQDTAGQERFSSLSSAFFRGADAAVLCFDANDRQSLRSLTKWWDEFRQRTPVAD